MKSIKIIHVDKSKFNVFCHKVLHLLIDNLNCLSTFFYTCWSRNIFINYCTISSDKGTNIFRLAMQFISRLRKISWNRISVLCISVRATLYKFWRRKRFYYPYFMLCKLLPKVASVWSWNFSVVNQNLLDLVKN